MIKVRVIIRTIELECNDPPIAMDVMVLEHLDGPELALNMCKSFSEAYQRDTVIIFQLSHGPARAIPARNITLFQIDHIYGKV